MRGGCSAMATDTAHVFAHLGQPPYRLVSIDRRVFRPTPDAPGRPGATCDHCGTAIVETFTLTSADGHTFHVGNVCIAKSGDRGLYSITRKALLAAQREARHVTASQRFAVMREMLLDSATRDRLAARDHPMRWGQDRGLTMLDWATWMLAHAGDKGRGEVWRVLRSVA